ncbi:MAG: hypothetical protein KAG53_05085 [Endozoicomonadaceae bacterium]|nr:hypothetical protein [Endozoicomonadaceae bacterium]
MEATNIVPNNVVSPLLNQTIDNINPAQFNKKYTTKVKAQLQILETVKVRHALIKSRRTIARKILSAIATVAKFIAFVAALTMVLAPIAFVLAPYLIGIGASLLTLAILYSVFIGVPTLVTSGFLATYTKEIFSGRNRSEHHETLNKIEQISDHCFENIPKEHHFFYFLWILMELQQLESINKDTAISNDIEKIYAKMNKILDSKDGNIIREKLCEYAQKLDKNKDGYRNMQQQKFNLKKSSVDREVRLST